MRALSWTAIFVLWLREMKRFVRARSRLVGTLVMPLLLFVSFGTGFRHILRPDAVPGSSYEDFLLPGILGMSILLSSTFAGISVLWDREFGFLREIMVAPVSRLSIVAGRIAGGVTTSLLQVLIILAVAMAAGFRPTSALLLVPALALAVLTSIGFIALGLAFASNMHDMQGFNFVMSFVILPMFLFSGALFPLAGTAPAIRALARLDPLAYAVDGLRACLLGQSELRLVLDVGVVAGFTAATVLLGVFFFERYEGA